jgi:hypothetical protein
MYVMKAYEVYCATEKQSNSASALHRNPFKWASLHVLKGIRYMFLYIKIDIFQQTYLIICIFINKCNMF